jgi:DNA polymerase III epsilon subunit-like protein
MMNYISIDIETLGLDPETCDIVEFGAVIENGAENIEDLPKFHAYITKSDKNYKGNIYAINLHAENGIIKKLNERKDKDSPHAYFIGISRLEYRFKEFLSENNYPLYTPITVAGKNFANFDQPFLKYNGFPQTISFDFRTIDLGNLFLRSSDEQIPSLQECKRRAGIGGKVAHTAVADALDVVECIRWKFGS